MLNLLVHRDYSFSASALISIYTDRIEFVSIGGLMPGIDLEDIMAGISICRNQDLANVFYRLHLIEAYGTGIRKIMKAYENMEEKPMIETTRNTFKIILPNRNVRNDIAASVSEAESSADSDAKMIKMADGQEEEILKYVRDHNSFTKNDIVNLLQVSPSTAARLIRGLIKRDLLKCNGKARSTYYTIP